VPFSIKLKPIGPPVCKDSPRYGFIQQTFSIIITGGKPPFSINNIPDIRQITLSTRVNPPVAGQSVSHYVIGTDGSNPQQQATVKVVIECPKSRPSYPCETINVTGMDKDNATRTCHQTSDGLCHAEFDRDQNDGYYCAPNTF